MFSKSKHSKSWVLTTSADYTPTGALQLGQLLGEPWNPDSAILAEGVIPVRPTALKDELTHEDIDFQSAEANQTSFQAWVETKAAVPASAEARAAAQSSAQAKYRSSKLMVHCFLPSDSYAKECLKAGDAPTRTKVPWYQLWNDVYLVTGIRVLAKGTSISAGQSQSADAGAKAAADVGAAVLPGAGLLDVGVDANHQSSSSIHQSIGSSDAFIYAYRLHKIKVWRDEKTTAVEPYEDGEAFSMEPDGEEEEDGGKMIYEGVKFEEIEEEAFDGNKLDHEQRRLFVE